MGQIRVLLVDDHPVVREGLRTMLGTASDIEVIAEAGDGGEAIEKISEHQPDVVLMDIRMPDMDGLEATRRIRSHSESPSVIVLTVYGNDAYVVDAVAAGASGYLLKDASRELLIHTIRAVRSGGLLIKDELLREAMMALVSAARDNSKREAVGIAALDALTAREGDVLRLVTQGKSNKEIARALSISDDTAKKHVQAILLKLGVSDRTQAAVKAVRAGLSEYSTTKGSSSKPSSKPSSTR